jgi:hypothetical protein
VDLEDLKTGTGSQVHRADIGAAAIRSSSMNARGRPPELDDDIRIVLTLLLPQVESRG